MFPPLDPVHILLSLVGLLGVVLLLGRFVVPYLAPVNLFGHGADDTRRRCRYCHRRQAYLARETARCEGQELVEVRCFVCRRCGLPQWHVSRTALIQRVR